MLLYLPIMFRVITVFADLLTSILQQLTFHYRWLRCEKGSDMDRLALKLLSMINQSLPKICQHYRGKSDFGKEVEKAKDFVQKMLGKEASLIDKNLVSREALLLVNELQRDQVDYLTGQVGRKLVGRQLIHCYDPITFLPFLPTVQEFWSYNRIQIYEAYSLLVYRVLRLSEGQRWRRYMVLQLHRGSSQNILYRLLIGKSRQAVHLKRQRYGRYWNHSFAAHSQSK